MVLKTLEKWTRHETYIECAERVRSDSSIIGYARVSTDDQDLAMQITALKNAGCARIYLETESTRNFRPVFENLKEALTACGDVLKFWRLDRLGRDLVEMILTVQHFQNKGVELISLQESLNLSDAVGKLMFHILASFAQYERDLIRERTIAGMLEAKRQGKILGNPTKIFGKHKVEMLVDIWNPTLTNKDICQRNGYKSTATMFNHFKGEKGRVREAWKLGPFKFKQLRKARLLEVAQQEAVSKYQLHKIIKSKEPHLTPVEQ